MFKKNICNHYHDMYKYMDCYKGDLLTDLCGTAKKYIHMVSDSATIKYSLCSEDYPLPGITDSYLFGKAVRKEIMEQQFSVIKKKADYRFFLVDWENDTVDEVSQGTAIKAYYGFMCLYGENV